MNSFTRSVDLLQREMDVTSLRYQVTENNLANSEVPNYKKQYVNFESELKRVEGDLAQSFILKQSNVVFQPDKVVGTYHTTRLIGMKAHYDTVYKRYYHNDQHHKQGGGQKHCR